MKRLLTILSLFLCTLSVHAQHSVFVLVDISRSISQNQLTDAKQALNEVLTGSALSKAVVTQGTLQDLSKFKLVQGDSISISTFGSLQTTLAINPNPIIVQNITADADQLINSIAWRPVDNETYITLAKAKIAEYAKNHKINSYKLYVISDNIQDDYGHNGRPNYPDEYTRKLVEGYNSSASGVIEMGYTKIKFEASSLYTLSFSPSVDVINYQPGGGAVTPPKPAITQPPIPAIPAITLTSFANGKKDTPKPTNSNSFTISWTCNCPTGTTFNVLLSEIDGGKYRDQKRNLATNSVKFNDVPSGEFKIIVLANSADSAVTFVETPGGGFGWVIFFLLVLAAVIIAYYFWDKKRKEKIDRFTSNNDDIFSGRNTGATTGNTSSSSEYF